MSVRALFVRCRVYSERNTLSVLAAMPVSGVGAAAFYGSGRALDRFGERTPSSSLLRRAHFCRTHPN